MNHVHNPTLPCSCYVQHRPYGIGVEIDTERIVYCPTHGAAPELLAALEATGYPDRPCYYGGDCNGTPGFTPCASCRARAAIAKAKGGKA